jgi:DNA-binding response OmpR family regulator
VVDDNASVARSLAMLLQESGYVTAVAYSGESAVEMASGIAADLALLDIHLPDVNGIRVAMEICRHLPNCRILLISGDPDVAALIEKSRAEGLRFPVLAKPVSPSDLLTEIASLLSGARDSNDR